MLISSSRIPRHLLVAGSAWVSRVVTAVVQLASVRILMDSLGLDNYAVFALLTGLMGWFILADLGVGVSAQNFISESRAKNQVYGEFISASGILAALLLFATVIALYFVSPLIAPRFLKNFPLLSDSEKVKLFFYTGALSIAFGVGGIAYKIWYAEQKGYLSNIVPSVAALVGFAGLLLATRAPVDARLFLSMVAFLAPTAAFPLVALAVLQFRNGIAPAGPRSSNVIGRITKRALHFWAFTIMAATVLQIDYIVISQFLNSHDIATYSLSTKVFGLAFFVYNAILLALWPIFAESIAKHEWRVVMQYLRKYILFGLAFMFASTLLLTWLMPVAIKALAPRENIIIPMGFTALLGLYQMIRVWTDTFSMLLQSMNDLRPFWILAPIQALISAGLQWWLAPRFGIYGVVWGLIGSFVLTVMWGLPVAAMKNFRISLKGAG